MGSHRQEHPAAGTEGKIVHEEAYDGYVNFRPADRGKARRYVRTIEIADGKGNWTRTIQYRFMWQQGGQKMELGWGVPLPIA